jgi:hypothetical protein
MFATHVALFGPLKVRIGLCVTPFVLVAAPFFVMCHGLSSKTLLGFLGFALK